MYKIRVFDANSKKWIHTVTGVSIKECEQKLEAEGYQETSRYLWLR